MAATGDFFGDMSGIKVATVVDYPTNTPGLEAWMEANSGKLSLELCLGHLRDSYILEEYRQASNILILHVPRESGGGTDIKGFAILSIVPSNPSDPEEVVMKRHKMAEAAEAEAAANVVRVKNTPAVKGGPKGTPTKKILIEAATAAARTAALAAQKTRADVYSLRMTGPARMPVICAEKGMKYGKMLLDKATQVARAAGKTTIRLKAISEDLVKKVYGPYGYTPIESSEDKWSDDHAGKGETVMELKLSGGLRLNVKGRRTQRNGRGRKSRKSRKLTTRRR
jgi:hypothetical protein